MILIFEYQNTDSDLNVINKRKTEALNFSPSDYLSTLQFCKAQLQNVWRIRLTQSEMITYSIFTPFEASIILAVAVVKIGSSPNKSSNFN